MLKKIRDNWFGIFIGCLIFVSAFMVAIVSIAPHNDDEMRGFSKCSYELAQDLSVYSAKKDVLGVMEAVFGGYWCYGEVIVEGGKLFLQGKQETPWSNYIFEVDNMEIPPKLSEPFSEDLIKANKLDDEEGDVFVVKGE